MTATVTILGVAILRGGAMKADRRLAAALAAWTAFFPIFFQLTAARAADTIVNSAEQGQNDAINILGQSATLPTVRAIDPFDSWNSNENEIFVKEILPGADASQLGKYEDTFDHPNTLKDFTTQEMRNVKGVGCEKINFEFVSNDTVAWVEPRKVKKVVVTDPATGKDIIEYQDQGIEHFVHQWFYLTDNHNPPTGLPLNFPPVPSIAGTAMTKDYFVKELAPDTYLVYRWHYSPYAAPADGTYFAYNHRISGADATVIADGKNLSNRYQFSGRVLPSTVYQYITFHADIYRVKRVWLDPDVVGFPCPPTYPPGSTIDGVNIVNGGVDFSDILTNREKKIYHAGNAFELLMRSHNVNELDSYSPEIQQLAATAAGFSSFNEFSQYFSGCTEDANIVWGKGSAHREDIYTCSSVRDDLDEGCNGERKTRFDYVMTKDVLRVTAEWLGRDCPKEGQDRYDDCLNNTCPADAQTEYTSCNNDCDNDYNACINAGTDQSTCDSEHTSCKSDCTTDYNNNIGGCPSECAVERDTLIDECNEWNTNNAGPYDMTGKVWPLTTRTVGAGNETITSIEDVPPSKVKYTTYITPFGGNSLAHFSYNHTIQGATGSITDYGDALNNWAMTGTATAVGSEFSVEADIYAVQDNYIDGCEDYLMFLADGMCVEWQDGDFDCSSGECELVNSSAVDLHCTNDRGPCTTLDGVSFCENTGPNTGIAKLLPRWGFDKMAIRGNADPDSCASGEPGPPVKFLPTMCWEASGGPLDCSKIITGLGDCWTDPQGDVHCVNGDGSGLTGTNFSPDGYKDDCDEMGYPSRNDCRLVSTNVCKECAEGVASGTCYAYSIEWDCGTDMDYDSPDSVTYTQSCDGTTMRCMGTECHNVKGESNPNMQRALAALEMLDQMRTDLVCEETGKPPSSPNEPCTLRYFNGKKQTCKIPIGHQIGLTPNCCEEGAEAAAGIDALAYLQLIYYTNKLGLFDKVFDAVSGMGKLPGLTEIFEKFTGAKQAISQTLLPAETPFSGIANEISKEGWAQTIVNHTGAFGKAITSILNSLAESLNSFLADMFDQAFADSIIKAGGQGQLPQLGPALQIIMYVYLVYQILKILGHLIFKCEEDELKLGIERKVGNCHYVGSYCAKDTFLGCVQTNESYCCFSSPLARIIHEQARAQGVGADPFMRRKGYGKPKHPRCKGLTLTEMSQIDWNAIDLTEWISLLQDAGIHPSTANPSDMVGIGP